MTESYTAVCCTQYFHAQMRKQKFSKSQSTRLADYKIWIDLCIDVVQEGSQRMDFGRYTRFSYHIRLSGPKVDVSNYNFRYFLVYLLIIGVQAN